MNIAKSILISLCIFNTSTNCDIVTDILSVCTQFFTQLYKVVLTTISSFTKTRINQTTQKITAPINNTVYNANQQVSSFVNAPMKKFAASTQKLTDQLKMS